MAFVWLGMVPWLPSTSAVDTVASRQGHKTIRVATARYHPAVPVSCSTIMILLFHSISRRRYYRHHHHHHHEDVSSTSPPPFDPPMSLLLRLSADLTPLTSFPPSAPPSPIHHTCADLSRELGVAIASSRHGSLWAEGRAEERSELPGRSETSTDRGLQVYSPTELSAQLPSSKLPVSCPRNTSSPPPPKSLSGRPPVHHRNATRKAPKPRHKPRPQNVPKIEPQIFATTGAKRNTLVRGPGGDGLGGVGAEER